MGGRCGGGTLKKQQANSPGEWPGSCVASHLEGQGTWYAGTLEGEGVRSCPGYAAGWSWASPATSLNLCLQRLSLACCPQWTVPVHTHSDLAWAGGLPSHGLASGH